MRKIAIVTRGMMVGGIERALISMLKNFNYNNYEIDLYIVEAGGELESEIPKQVNIKYIYGKRLRESIVENIKRFNIVNLFNLFFSGFETRWIKNRYKLLKKMAKRLPKADKKYDIAISYHNPITIPTIFTIDKLKANKKIMWIHSDINQYIEIVDDFKEYYEKYDVIFGVSRGVIEVFSDRYPDLIKKCRVFYNYISRDELLSKTNKEHTFDDKDKINILTVGRLSWEKGMHMIPEIVEKLKNDNYKFKWYIVGDGEERYRITNNIEEKDLKEDLILLGNKMNPYNYIRDCSIYVQTSLYEAYSTTITEAKCFNKPIIGTKVIGISEQIKNGINGILVDSSIDEVYKAIKALINDENLRRKLSSNLEKEKIDTTEELKKIDQL